MTYDERRKILNGTFPSSNFTDYKVGDIVEIIDPKGRSADFLAGKFDIGDLAVVVDIGGSTMTVRVKRTKHVIGMYKHRFKKVESLFHKDDIVMAEIGESVVKELYGETALVTNKEGKSTEIKYEKLELISRRKII